MPTSNSIAMDLLRAHGEVNVQGFEIWETHTEHGYYTGHYRMAPSGEREHYRDYMAHTDTLKNICDFLKNIS